MPDENIHVVARLRPGCEGETGEFSCLEKVNERELVLHRHDLTNKTFVFDHIFGPEDTQETIYKEALPNFVDGLIQGINHTVLAYGQTGSGKTHTMIGASEHGEGGVGIIPRLLKEIFQRMDEAKDMYRFAVDILGVEVYQDEVFDLMAKDSEGGRSKATLLDTGGKGLMVQGVNLKVVGSYADSMKAYREIAAHRAVGSTKMNSRSSRSHLLFILNLQTYERATKLTRSSQLLLVDLAGSEMVSKTGATGRRLGEAKEINSSLLHLGVCVNAKVKGAPGTYIPFRNCKLTRILENSLSGNSRTLLIATLSPNVSNRTESRNTLCFAQRASKLETRITVQKKVTKETLQRELKEQATVLKEKEKELAEKVRWIEAMDELIYTLKAMGVEDDYEERFDFATEHK